MEKIFWSHPYQKKIETAVSKVHDAEVLFSSTIAYSFSGGQESDKAFVNDIPILGSRMNGPLIYYTLPDNHGLHEGEKVLMTIDWPRRYKLMRLHFAAELILEIVTQNYHLEKSGAHIAEHKARIDFLSEINIGNLFDTIVNQYDTIINANLPIETGYIDQETQRRYWKIDGFATVPCGGTHVKSTQEVGHINLKRSKPGKGIERLEIALRTPDKHDDC